MTETGAAEHLDRLASKYAGRPMRFLGDCVPARFAKTEIPVLAGSARPTSRRSMHGGEAMTGLVVRETVRISASHLDLLTRPIWGVLTTWAPMASPSRA